MYTGDDCGHVLQRPILSLYHILLMIAIDTPVCYTEPMKKTVVILCGLLLVSVALYGGLAEQLVMFVLIGRVPFTNLILPAMAMLAFWVLVVPLTLLTRRTISAVVWRIVEYIGTIHQRRLNIRWHQQLRIRRSHSVRLYAVALLHVAEQLPDSSTENPELYFRRRFIALPA